MERRLRVLVSSWVSTDYDELVETASILMILGSCITRRFEICLLGFGSSPLSKYVAFALGFLIRH